MRISFTALVLVLCCGQLAIADQSASRFEAPDRQTREKAIGATDQLPPELKRAFQQSDDFSPIPLPGPSDWLSNHLEDGQTFGQYKTGRRNHPSKTRNIIYIQPLGEFPKPLAPDLQLLREFAVAYFAMPVKIERTVKVDELPVKKRNRANDVRQLSSRDILRWLETRVPRDAYCVLAVTMDDLYPDPGWNFVFGQASLIKPVGVYSFARYEPSFYGDRSSKETEPLVLLRSCKVLAHETGHIFGIKHCIHFHCVMNGSNHLAETDAQPLHLCPVCLRKLQTATNFDIVDRYKKLKALSVKHGWTEESKWLGRRLQRLIR